MMAEAGGPGDAPPIRVLIVDDEPLARERLRRLLEKEGDVELAGECEDGNAAIEAISDLRPDLVFLDIQMPGRDGFAVIKAVGPEKMPAVIFVTAFDRYALRAFEVHALDYLLKPFDAERFAQALSRARQRVERGGGGGQGLAPLLESVGGRVVGEDEDPGEGDTAGFAIPEADIDYVEAAGNYVKLHTLSGVRLLRETMAHVEQLLDPARFLRIHRSTIVNLASIEQVQPWFHGDYAVILRDGTRLTMSRGYRDKLKELL